MSGTIIKERARVLNNPQYINKVNNKRLVWQTIKKFYSSIKIKLSCL